jgi:hypothetical protein
MSQDDIVSGVTVVRFLVVRVLVFATISIGFWRPPCLLYSTSRGHFLGKIGRGMKLTADLPLQRLTLRAVCSPLPRSLHGVVREC